MESEIRKKILALLEQHRIMTVATLRPDGRPRAMTQEERKLPYSTTSR